MYTGTRGCGTLEYGKVYANWSLGANGIPIHTLIVDPIFVIDPEAWGLSAQGMNIRPRMLDGKQVVDSDGDPIWDVYDVVGATHYRYKTDFYEEVCRYGISRKFPTNTPLDNLKIGVSRHYLCHFKAALRDNRTVKINAENHNRHCLAKKHDWPLPDSWKYTCSGFWHSEIPLKHTTEVGNARYRKTLSVLYRVDPVEQPQEYDFGIFMWLPIKRFAATLDMTGKLTPQQEAILEKLKKMGATTQVVDLNQVNNE